MEKALYGGRLRMAYKVAGNTELEKEIRNASKGGEILCPDIECKAPILKYCHGDVRTPYFSHKAKGACDYATFDKRDNDTFRDVRHALYEHFIRTGYCVLQEEKVLKHHYAHLMIGPGQIQSSEMVAIELGDTMTSLNDMQKINDGYQAQGIPVNWLLIDDEQRHARCAYRRYLEWYLHCGASNRHLVVISSDASEVAEYKVICNSNEVSQFIGSIDELDLIDGEIVLRKDEVGML